MPRSNQFTPIVCADLVATIASGQSESNAIYLGGATLVGLDIPANFDGTQIKILSCTTEGGTYVELEDGEGADLVIATNPSKRAPIANLALTASLIWMKLRTVTSQATTDTAVTLITRPV